MEYGTKPSVLVATSNAMQRKILQGALERASYQVTPVSSSDEALDELETRLSRFDLVIVDATLPGLGGLDVVRVLRYLDSKQQARAIVRADVISEEVRVAAIAAGADELLPVPVEEDLLLAVVRRLVPQQEQPAPALATA
jgi:DNA-binding response OmpR family regulator